jgi:hypothetical protein
MLAWAKPKQKVILDRLVQWQRRLFYGTVALREPGKVLNWKSQEIRIPNYLNAEKYLKKTYGKGWEVAGFNSPEKKSSLKITKNRVKKCVKKVP